MENLDIVMNMSSDAILVSQFRDDMIIFVNEGFMNLTGFKRSEVLNRTIGETKIWINHLDFQKIGTDIDKSGIHEELNTVFNRKDGSQFIGRVKYKKIELHGEPHLIISIQNVTAPKRLLEDTIRLSPRDELTGCFNSDYLYNWAFWEIKRANRLKYPLTIALLEIDQIKYINETYGQKAGDQTLVVFSKSCQANIRDIDTFARLGGDEFVLLLPGASYQHGYLILERINHAISTVHNELEGQEISFTVSTGISSLETKQDTFESLMSQAEQALRHAKASGRNRVVGYKDL